MVGVAGFEPTTSSSRTTIPARLIEVIALVAFEIRGQRRLSRWERERGDWSTADWLRTSGPAIGIATST